MRYSKELQEIVVRDMEVSGKTIAEIAEKYDIPKQLALKWSNLDYDESLAKEIVVKKYMETVNDAECVITNALSSVLEVDSISEREWDKLCNITSKGLIQLATNIVKEERVIMCDFCVPSTVAIVKRILDKWSNSDAIELYANSSSVSFNTNMTQSPYIKDYIKTGKSFEKKLN